MLDMDGVLGDMSAVEVLRVAPCGSELRGKPVMKPELPPQL